MNLGSSRTQIALAVVAAIGGGALAALPTAAVAAKTPGKYVAGDVHNHTTCSDGAISMEKLVKKSTDKIDTPWGLDWFVQAGHGGNTNTNRNCTLVEDATLGTPAYPYVSGAGPSTAWASTPSPPYPAVTLKGDPVGYMHRWQTLKEYQYPLLEYLSALQDKPLFLGLESVVAGHEHTSMSVVTGQMPAAIYGQTLPTAPPYNRIGNADALAQWTYCFDIGESETSRGAENQWDCSVPGGSGSGYPNWNDTAKKIIVPSGTGSGTANHLKTVEGLKWMVQFHPDASYYLPTHLERAGVFNPNGNNGFNVEHLRDFNNAAPRVAFGFETQPGHGASGDRGEYYRGRNGTSGDSVGGTTWGGTGIYGAYVGGVWDALLGEGRGYWFHASSDWHNRGSFGPDDRRSSQDFYPGEYQRSYSLVRNNGDKLRPQTIVDGMRSGNIWAASGQLIDRLAFVACASYPGLGARTNAQVEAIAVNAAVNNTDTDVASCATLGEKLKVRPGAEIVVSVVVRDPAGTNYSPYTFPNPSLVQIGVNQPLNAPVLDHVDLIRGMVTSAVKTSASPDYAGAWPNDFIDTATMAPAPAKVAAIPAAAKNPTAAVIKTFSAPTWTAITSPVDNTQLLKMSYRIPAVSASQYIRLRGTNLPPSTPWETDSAGNPLADLATNGASHSGTFLKIPCTTTGSNVPANNVTYTGAAIDGCPNHLPDRAEGGKWSAYDVAAWSDLWFYSNPIFIEVQGSQLVAGVQ